MASSTITLGYSIAGGMQIDISKTITLGYGIGDISTPLQLLVLDGTLTRELLLTGTITLSVSLNGTRTDRLEI